MRFAARGGEIDFVCGPRKAIEAVEVADWEHLNRQKATAPARALVQCVELREVVAERLSVEAQNYSLTD